MGYVTISVQGNVIEPNFRNGSAYIPVIPCLFGFGTLSQKNETTPEHQRHNLFLSEL